MLKISIIAKDQIVYQGEAKSVIVPTKSGIIEVLPSHMQLVSALVNGDFILQTDPSTSSGQEKTLTFKINGGVLEVRPHSEVIVLADMNKI